MCVCVCVCFFVRRTGLGIVGSGMLGSTRAAFEKADV